MIVKLCTTEIDAPKVSESSWVYFDGFRKVKSILLKDFDGDKVDVYNSDYGAIDYKDWKQRDTYLLICSLKYTEEVKGKAEYTILTNLKTYLLNDEGKTIERLV